MEIDHFIRVKRRVAGSGGVGNLAVAIAVVCGFGWISVLFTDGILRVVLCGLCLGVLSLIMATALSHKALERRISVLVKEAITTSRAINAKKVGQSFYDVWLEEGACIRITGWMLGVLKATPGIVIFEVES